MASLEEDELVQMVQDFIESESTSSTTSTSSNCHTLSHTTQYFILQVGTVLCLQFFLHLCLGFKVVSYLFSLCCLWFQDVLRSEGDAAAEAKVLKCVLKHMRGRKVAEKRTSLSRWLAMRMKMDGLNASICHTSWATSLGCPAGGSFFICLFTTSS